MHATRHNLLDAVLPALSSLLALLGQANVLLKPLVTPRPLNLPKDVNSKSMLTHVSIPKHKGHDLLVRARRERVDLEIKRRQEGERVIEGRKSVHPRLGDPNLLLQSEGGDDFSFATCSGSVGRKRG